MAQEISYVQYECNKKIEKRGDLVFESHFALRNIKKNKPGYLSPKDIVNGVINLLDAKKVLPQNDFFLVFYIYAEIEKFDEKILFKNFSEYTQYLSYLICQFDIIVPYYKICGCSDFMDMIDQNDEKKKSPYRIQAKEYLRSHSYKFENDEIWMQMTLDFQSTFYDL